MYRNVKGRVWFKKVWEALIETIIHFSFRHIEVSTGPSQHFVFSIRFYSGVDRGTVGFSAPQRKWATLSIGQVWWKKTCFVFLQFYLLQKGKESARYYYCFHNKNVVYVLNLVKVCYLYMVLCVNKKLRLCKIRSY